jgi:arylsulfatase A-like enzyme
MQWTGKIPRGTVYTNPVISLDILATITSISGATIDPEKPLDGVTLFPIYLEKKKGTRTNIYFGENGNKVLCRTAWKRQSGSAKTMGK